MIPKSGPWRNLESFSVADLDLNVRNLTFVGHASRAHVPARNLSRVTAHGAKFVFFMSRTTQIAFEIAEK